MRTIMATKKPTEEEPFDDIESFEKNLPKFMKTLRKAAENFPYPPGKQYRELGEKFRQEQARVLRAVAKTVEEKDRVKRSTASPKKKPSSK